MSREGAPLRIEGTGAKYGEWGKNELISLKLKRCENTCMPNPEQYATA